MMVKDNYSLFVYHITSIFYVQETTCSFSHPSTGRNELPGGHMRAGQPQPAQQHWHFPCLSEICAPSCQAGGGLSTSAFQAHMHRLEQARKQERQIYSQVWMSALHKCWCMGQGTETSKELLSYPCIHLSTYKITCNFNYFLQVITTELKSSWINVANNY